MQLKFVQGKEMPETSPNSMHVPTERTVAFLLDSEALEPAEHAHLSRCAECKTNMAAAACEELSRRKKGSETFQE